MRCTRTARRAVAAQVEETKSYETLRARYRNRWDAHQVIADHNARLLKAGGQPSNEQLINEQQAAEAVALARNELLAAISSGDAICSGESGLAAT